MRHRDGRRLAAILALAASLLIAGMAGAADAPIAVGEAWAKPTLRGTRTGAAYLTLTNHGSAPDRLLGLSAPVAERVELHRTIMKNGVMSMAAVPDFTLAPGATATIEPGTYHIMLIGMKQALKAGDSFPLTLTFEKAGAVEATVSVTATPPKNGAMPHMQ